MGMYERCGKEVLHAEPSEDGGSCVRYTSIAQAGDEEKADFLVKMANGAKAVAELTAVSIDPGNAHCDNYMRGMANGMLVANSVFTGEEPEFIGPEVVFDYMREADKTCSVLFNPQHIDRDAFVANLRAFVELGNVMNLYKKLLFRGKTPDQLSMAMPQLHNSLAVEFDPNNTAETTINVVHGAIGVITESGEVAELLLKAIEDGDRDDVNVLEESGDLLWYIARMLRGIDKGMDDCQRANINKLHGRHGATFDVERDANRNLIHERAQLEADHGAPLFEGSDPYVLGSDAIDLSAMERHDAGISTQAETFASEAFAATGRGPLTAEEYEAAQNETAEIDFGRKAVPPAVAAQLDGRPIPRTADMADLTDAERASAAPNVGIRPIGPGGVRE